MELARLEGAGEAQQRLLRVGAGQFLATQFFQAGARFLPAGGPVAKSFSFLIVHGSSIVERRAMSVKLLTN